MHHMATQKSAHLLLSSDVRAWLGPAQLEQGPTKSKPEP